MTAYEFYVRENGYGDRLLGILPERRGNPGRVNNESIMGWARTAFSSAVDISKVFFVRVVVEKNGNGYFVPRPEN
jgi:hypothetical protein